jgi:hypothetical protein
MRTYSFLITRADIPTRNPVSAPLIAKKQPYCSNSEPTGIAWRGCCEGVSQVIIRLARRDSGKRSLAREAYPRL